MSKYAGIGSLLKTQPGRAVTVPFSKIETVIGDSLPRSARKFRQWWENDFTSPSRQARAWLDAGWQVATVDFRAETVTFTKTH